MKPTILIVDDDRSIRESLKILLEDKYTPVDVSSGEEALDKLRAINVDAVLLDVKMEGMDGLETLKKIREQYEHVAVIMLTVVDEALTAVKAMKLGADDYLCKPYNGDELLLVIEKTLENRNLKRENLYYRSELESRFDSELMIGESEQMKEIFRLIDTIADKDTTVLITGETGTGKELVARRLHSRSPRRDKPFVTVNCAAIPTELFESELFGHEKGAFTGAHRRKLGKFELASGGTIFLDEIGSMPLHLQPKLLRVVEQKQTERVGGTTAIPVHVRVIAASKENLKEAVDKGNFREDLYFRLSVFPIVLPPLRERREDIPPLVDHFIKKFNLKHGKSVKRVSEEAMDCLVRFRWEGNVRQLENEMERVISLLDDRQTIITLDLLSEEIRGGEIRLPKEKASLKETVEALERQMIQEALERFSGNKTKAAELLGVSRRGFLKKLNRYGLVPPKK